jgi:hypothetical protein
MNVDRLAGLLADVSVPDTARACDATVAAARAAAPEPASGPAGRAAPQGVRWRTRAWRGARIALAAIVTLVAVAALTSPGRAALGEAAALIGQIGGAPASREDPHFEPTVPNGQPGSPVVVDNGEAPDGSRYEWVAFRQTKKLGSRSRQPTLEMFCVRFGWADVSLRARTGGCSSTGGWSPGVVRLTGRLARPATPGGARDYLMIGDVDPRVGRLRMFYRPPAGGRRELPVDHARIDGPLLRRAGGKEPFAVFSAFIPGEVAAADRLGSRHRLMSLSVVDPTFALPLPYSVRYKRCVRRHGGFFERGWIDVAIYDRRDRHVATLPTRTARRLPAACEGIRKADGDLHYTDGPIESPLRSKLLRAFPPRHSVP